MTNARRGLVLKAALGLVITLALFRLLFEFVDFEDLGAPFVNLRWGPWLLGWVLWRGGAVLSPGNEKPPPAKWLAGAETVMDEEPSLRS